MLITSRAFSRSRLSAAVASIGFSAIWWGSRWRRNLVIITSRMPRVISSSFITSRASVVDYSLYWYLYSSLYYFRRYRRYIFIFPRRPSSESYFTLSMRLFLMDWLLCSLIKCFPARIHSTHSPFSPAFFEIIEQMAFFWNIFSLMTSPHGPSHQCFPLLFLISLTIFEASSLRGCWYSRATAMPPISPPLDG